MHLTELKLKKENAEDICARNKIFSISHPDAVGLFILLRYSTLKNGDH